MATADKETARATEYLVLEQRELKDDEDKTVIAWVEAGTTNGGTSRTGAVTEIAGDREGIWRPVPTRNWSNAIRTRNETTTKLKVEPARAFFRSWPSLSPPRSSSRTTRSTRCGARSRTSPTTTSWRWSSTGRSAFTSRSAGRALPRGAVAQTLTCQEFGHERAAGPVRRRCGLGVDLTKGSESEERTRVWPTGRRGSPPGAPTGAAIRSAHDGSSPLDREHDRAPRAQAGPQAGLDRG